MTHTPEQLRWMREALGLTRAQLASIMDTDAINVQRIERPSDRVSARPAPARYARLLEAMVQGYRPEDWPLNEETTA